MSDMSNSRRKQGRTREDESMGTSKG